MEQRMYIILSRLFNKFPIISNLYDKQIPPQSFNAKSTKSNKL